MASGTGATSSKSSMVTATTPRARGSRHAGHQGRAPSGGDGRARTPRTPRRAEAEQIAARLAGATVVVPAKAGPEGKLFGSVTAADVTRALEAAGIEVERAAVELGEPVKEVGEVEFP